MTRKQLQQLSKPELIEIILQLQARVAELEEQIRPLTEPPEDLPVRHTASFTVGDVSMARHATSLSLTYWNLIPPSADAIYLSDLPEVSSIIHGGLKKNCAYSGNPLAMGGVVWVKSLQTHVESEVFPPHSEGIYDLSQLPTRQKLCALIGVADDAGGGGSVVFQVHIATDGEWETRYTPRCYAAARTLSRLQ